MIDRFVATPNSVMTGNSAVTLRWETTNVAEGGLVITADPGRRSPGY